MYSTAHQAATRPLSHKEDEVSEGARRDFRLDHQTILKFNAAHFDTCAQTEYESERAGPSSSRRRKKSVPTSSDPACSTLIKRWVLQIVGVGTHQKSFVKAGAHSWSLTTLQATKSTLKLQLRNMQWRCWSPFLKIIVAKSRCYLHPTHLHVMESAFNHR